MPPNSNSDVLDITAMRTIIRTLLLASNHDGIRLQALNKLGSMLGDERAGKTRKKWGRPLLPVLITDTGVLA